MKAVDNGPKLVVEEYFNGPIKAWGIIQNRSGAVLTRFDIDLVGTWNGNEGVLEEDFFYYNGTEKRRVWYITKEADGSYTGRADDVPGDATGTVKDKALHWQYQMEIPVGDKTYRVTLDDWMWQMNDGVLINRTKIKKFGFTVADLTIFMKKI